MTRIYHDLEFLDFEASSLHPRDSYPIEVGFTLGDEVFSSLIRPIDTWTDWDLEAQKVHGIFQRDMWNHGLSPRDVCYWMNSLLAGKILWCDGTQMDVHWLKRLYDAGEMEPWFELCNIWSLLDHYKLIPAYKEAKRLRLQSSHGHRAGWDARMLKDILISFD